MSDFDALLDKLTSEERLCHPFVVPDKRSLADDLRNRLSVYENLIGKATNSEQKGLHLLKKRLNKLGEINGLLSEAIEKYLLGDLALSYRNIDKVLKEDIVKKSFKVLTKTVHKHCLDSYPLFRVRVSDTHIGERPDIFHVPFELRHSVSMQRYSVNGLPSLYLSRSLYACWQEVGRPELDKLYVSRLQVNSDAIDDFDVLNLAFSLELIANNKKKNSLFDESPTNEEMLSYLTIFPLVLACSYTRKNSFAEFNEEYIVPNLMLQWIVKNSDKTHGIAYFSTKTKQLRHSEYGISFVFPPIVDTVKVEGFCPILSNRFLLTKPVSWQIIDSLPCEENSSEGSTHKSFAIDDIEEAFLANYKATKFYRAEKILQQFPTDKI
ncbi:MAG: hypothetical protein R3273_06600 [Pseudidiomarina maritima]|nr:hypothetical protein [Pseudidiomarina maritima]